MRESHDVFWERYQEQRKIKKQEFLERIQNTLEKIEGNISKNREKKSNAEEALERQVLVQQQREPQPEHELQDAGEHRVEDGVEQRELRHAVGHAAAAASAPQ